MNGRWIRKSTAILPGFEIRPHDSRFYALYRHDELVAVCVYKKGAINVMRLLAGPQDREPDYREITPEEDHE